MKALRIAADFTLPPEAVTETFAISKLRTLELIRGSSEFVAHEAFRGGR